MRKILYSLAIAAGVFVVPALVDRDGSAAVAGTLTQIENAPCGWFTSLYPGAWGTDHKVLINPNIVVEGMSFGRGTYQLADGADAYDFLEKRCGY